MSEMPPPQERPMTDTEELRSSIQDLLSAERLAVLATEGDGQPYTSLVTMAATEDLRRVLFPTLRRSTKFAHLTHNPRVSVLLDNRCHRAPGSPQAMALTIIGIASEVASEDAVRLRRLYLNRHPHLSRFLDDPECALVQVEVQRYRLVRQLQDISELHIDSEVM
jgi:general stress protein 26